MRTSNQPKLILIEGIPGSGKTTTATFIDTFLKERGLTSQLFLEGNLDTPADYDATSCLDEKQFNQLIASNKEHEALLKDMAIPYGNDVFIYYWKEKMIRGDLFPDTLLSQIAQFDIYNGLPLLKHQQLLLERWTQFVKDHHERDSTIILDCSFLQNPMCKFLIQHNAKKEMIEEHILQIAKIISPLNPVLIYLAPSNVSETIHNVIPERPKQWIEGVISYHTEQEFGKANGLSGLKGYIESLEARQVLELEICNTLSDWTFILDDKQSWGERHEKLKSYLELAFELQCK